MFYRNCTHRFSSLPEDKADQADHKQSFGVILQVDRDGFHDAANVVQFHGCFSGQADSRCF